MNDSHQSSLSTYEVARKLGISPQAVRGLCKYGKIPGAYQTHKNGYWRIPANSLELINLKEVKNPLTWYDKAKYVIWANKLRSLTILVVGVFTFFFAAIGTGADIGGAREQLIEWGIVRTFPKAIDGEILIVICRFNYSDNLVDTRIEEEIKRQIEVTLSNFNINNFRVEIDHRRIRASEYDKAYKLISQHNAAIVIWGEDTGVRVTVNMASPFESKPIIEETDFTQLANPNQYQSFIISKLPAHVSFISLFASGLVLERDNYYRQAIDIIEKAVKDLDPEVPVEGVTNAYYALGNLYLQEDGTDIEAGKKAIEYYNLVVDLAPNKNTESGMVYQDRGVAKVVIKDLNGALSDFKIYAEKITNIDKDDVTPTAYSYRGMARIVVAKDYSGGIEDVLYSQELINSKKIKCFNVTLLAEGYLQLLLNSLPDSLNSVFDPTAHLALADKIIELDPSDCNEAGATILASRKTFAYLIRGNINSQLGNHELALSDFQNLLIINPDFKEREAIEKNIEFEKSMIESSK